MPKLTLPNLSNAIMYNLIWLINLTKKQISRSHKPDTGQRMILQQFNSMLTMSHPAFYVTENVVLCKYQGMHAPSPLRLEERGGGGGGKNLKKVFGGGVSKI